MSLTFALVLCSCSSDRDNVDIKEEWPVNKEIPTELIGNWKINYIAMMDQPDMYYPNSFGAYINIKSDNTVEYYDLNKSLNKKFTMPVEKVNGNSIENGNTVTFLAYQDRQKIACKKSLKYPGQIEFTIIYASDSPHTNTTLIGTKQ